MTPPLQGSTPSSPILQIATPTRYLGSAVTDDFRVWTVPVPLALIRDKGRGTSGDKRRNMVVLFGEFNLARKLIKYIWDKQVDNDIFLNWSLLL